MKTSKTILVPLDFSACSDNALAFAIKLSLKLGASIQVLNIPSLNSGNMVSPVAASFSIEGNLRQTRKRINRTIQNAIEKTTTEYDKPIIQTIVEMGNVESTIVDVAERNKVDYIVMGTQGENSRIDKYLGSIASNVLKKAPCPVFVIPEKADFHKDTIVGYATDFMDADPYEIWKIMKRFSPSQSKVKCIHFNGKETRTEKKVKELKSFFADAIPDLDIEFYNLLSDDKVKDMNIFIEQQNINLLVMYKPNRTFLGSIFHKSYTQSMAKHTNVPLLILKEV